MTFDAKSLLTAPLPADLTVDRLITALEHLKAMGLGKAGIKTADGIPFNALELVAQGTEPAHFVLKRKVAAPPAPALPGPQGEMINGETVEIRYQNQDCWYVGTVYRAYKLQVELTNAVAPDDAAPKIGEIACENTIAEWRRPGSQTTFWNPLARDRVRSDVHPD